MRFRGIRLAGLALVAGLTFSLASAQQTDPNAKKDDPKADPAAKQRQKGAGGRARGGEPAEVLLTLGDPQRHWDIVRAVAFSPDGKWFASASDDGSVKLRDAATGKEERVFSGRANRQLSVAFYAVAFSPDSKLLGAGSADKTVRIWDAVTGELKATLVGHRDAVAGIAFSPDGKLLAEASDDRTVRLWDVVNPTVDPETRAGIPGVVEPPIKEVKVFDRVGDFVSAVAWSPDGKTIAVGLWDKTVRLWDATTGEERRILSGHTARISSLAFTRDSLSLVSSALEGTVRVWSVSDGAPRAELIGHRGAVFSASVSPESSRIATAGHDGTVRIWEADGKPLRTLTTHQGAAMGVAFSPDGKRLASGGADGVTLFTPLEGNATKLGAGNLVSVAYSADGKQIVTGDDVGTIRVWESETGTERKHASLGTSPVFALSAGRAGKLFAAASGDGRVAIVVDEAEPAFLAGHQDAVRSVALSPDGKYLVSGSADKTAIVWDVVKREAVRKLTGHDGTITSVLFTPDGKSIVTAADDRAIKVWDAEDGRLLRTLDPDEDDDVLAVAVRSDGKQLASVGNRDVPPTVKLWDHSNGAVLRIMPGHLDRSLAASYRPDGKVLATVAGDGSIRFWDTEGFTPIKAVSLRSPRGTVSQVAFHPSGDRVATVNGNGTVTVVKVPEMSPAKDAIVQE